MASVEDPDQDASKMTHAQTHSDHSTRDAEREKFRISRFDVLTSFFMALMLFIGVFVFMLFVIWLTSRWTFAPLAIAPIIENPAGRGDNAEGFERDFEPPGAEEVEELLEPTLQDTIEAVTDAVSSVAASLTTNDTAATATTSGTGAGDSRPPGPEGEGEDIIPRFERWQLNFTARDIPSYAKQLDFYNIELGAIGGSKQGVDAVNNLASKPTARLIVDTESEKRLYFMFKTPSPLMQFDLSLLNAAGVQTQGRTPLKFIPTELENKLAFIELEYSKAKGHPSVTEIAKTVFESKSAGGNFEFEVTSQRYRKPKK
ncbi:hypothetical protein [Rubripirellula reticaptiva]|uniref:Transmembrane protein n=1 Tax=Rubripirellula reticaptiva TaxID=2528013 RepID=A0A5C6FC66_9BACT|nr:hypothetical protein [Rubripirellula reticaptiva]TWU57219.1 hypothetical protein Poly59_01260 [Rubripirellula reticaptiva]